MGLGSFWFKIGRTVDAIYKVVPLFFILLVGCSLLPNDLKEAETVLQTNPDSALNILKKIRPSNFVSDGEKAMYGLLYFEALDKSKLTLKPDSLINFSLKYYLRSNDNIKLAKSYYFKAKTLKIAQQFDNATMLYLRALDLLKNGKENQLLGKIYSDMGDISSLQKDYSESLKKYNQSLIYFYNAGDSIEASYSLIYIGRVYRFLNNYKTAKSYYKKALANTKDSLSNGLAFQEMGINFYSAKNLDSAQLYLRKSLIYPYVSNYYSIRCYILADLFFDIQQYDSASHYAKTALKYPSTFFIQRDCYRVLSNTEYIKKDFKQLAYYLSKYQDCTDSVRKVETQTKSSVLENLYLTTDKVGKTRRYLLLSGFAIAIIVGLGVFIVYRLRKRNKGKEVLLKGKEEQLKQVEEKLTTKQEVLRENLIQRIDETRAGNAAAYKKASIAEREALDREVYNKCLHINDRAAFSALMNKSFNNVITKLETRYPEINEKELLWSGLFLLGISNKDIALILDTQPTSLYKMKQRLAQKMQLAGTRELDQLLVDFSEQQ